MRTDGMLSPGLNMFLIDLAGFAGEICSFTSAHPPPLLHSIEAFLMER